MRSTGIQSITMQSIKNIVLMLLTIHSIVTATFAQDRLRDSLDTVRTLYEHRTDTLAARVLAEIAVEYVEFDSRFAVSIAQRADSLGLAMPVSSQRARILNNVGYVFRADGRYTEALEYFSRALTIAKTIGDNGETAQALVETGVIEGYLGKVDKEFGYFVEAVPFAERSGNPRLLALALYRLASAMYYTKKNYHRADSLYTEALRLCGEGNDEIRARVLMSRANFSNFLKQPERQLRDYREALAINKNLGYLRSVGRTCSNLGWMFTQRGELDSALFYMNECVRLYEETKYAGGLANALTTLALVQNKRGRYNEAIASAQRALSYSIPLGELPEQLTAYENLSESYSALGNYRNAWDAEKSANDLQKKMYNGAVAKNLAELERLQKEQQIELLQRDKARQDILRNGLILVLILVLMYSVTLVRNNLRKNRDNAYLQELNHRLERQNTDLTTYNAEKNEIMGIVAHDLKNPIAAVRGFADLIHTGLVEKPQTEEIAGVIVGTADRMLGLVENLLDVNRLEQEGAHFTLIAFDCTPIIESVIEQYQQAAAAKDISLHYSSLTSRNIIFADEQALMQVLDNLVSNAVKYSPHGKNVFVRIKDNGNGQRVNNNTEPSSLDSSFLIHHPSAFIPCLRIEVADEGPGISPEDMKKLFGKFARLSARPTGGEHSTGLGLSIVKKMVEAMNGRVWCESELGKGATFIVELPMFR